MNICQKIKPYARIKTLLTIAFVITMNTGVFASGEDRGSSEKFEAGKMITHHILDSHEWHLWDIRDENGVLHPVSVPLPIIFYHKGHGLQMFMSSKFDHGKASYKGYAMHHENIVYEGEGGHAAQGEDHGSGIIDFSITKNVVTILLVALLVILIFTGIGKAYNRKPNSAPKGIQSFFEPIIMFIRDDIAIPIIGEHKAGKFLPFLLSVFFFIWFGNMLGLIPFIPGGANMTGNISITIVLAAITFFITLKSANKHYWQHVFAMPGVPWPLYFILTPIEIIGVFLKPLVLAIRLFANITAGHITILAFISLIFILGEKSAVAGYGVSIASIALSVFMTFLEILVAFLQAFIFTLLSATYFASATEEAHH
ncbi:MAG: F0F1 ATP synthase subunit A [Flavobacteriales bacterium]|nr:F0F1 ATP synthase subunit A [Flavobacteriales bacterium]